MSEAIAGCVEGRGYSQGFERIQKEGWKSCLPKKTVRCNHCFVVTRFTIFGRALVPLDGFVAEQQQLLHVEDAKWSVEGLFELLDLPERSGYVCLFCQNDFKAGLRLQLLRVGREGRGS